MANDWIIDVISDLRTYALNNQLPALARQLDEATLVAAAEIASSEGGVENAGNWDAAGSGRVYRSPSIGELA